MKLIPTKDRLLISQLPKATISSGGIHTIAQYNDDRSQWKVEAIGPKVKEVQVGDHILTHMNYDYKMLDDGRAVIPEKDVLAVFGSVSGTSPA